MDNNLTVLKDLQQQIIDKKYIIQLLQIEYQKINLSKIIKNDQIIKKKNSIKDKIKKQIANITRELKTINHEFKLEKLKSIEDK